MTEENENWTVSRDGDCGITNPNGNPIRMSYPLKAGKSLHLSCGSVLTLVSADKEKGAVVMIETNGNILLTKAN